MTRKPPIRGVNGDAGTRADSRWLDRAVELAERGRFTVSPNPMVGAVVVKSGRVIGEGFHRRAGESHAEVEALGRAGDQARGATLYVSLEPCGHQGRTPPCADAILAAGVARVVAASRDPNPLVSGRGMRRLRGRGVVTAWGGTDARARADRQNEKFRTFMELGRPFVLAKWAASLDGKIAAATGESRWISGPESRRRSLALREEYDAILVGAGTVLADDPRLTRRLGLARGTPHRRIVIDGRLRVSERAKVFADPSTAILVTSVSEDDPRARRFTRRGIAVWSLPGRSAGTASSGSVDLPKVLRRLAREAVGSVIVEGGAATLWGFFRAGLVDRVTVFLAPRILGGSAAPGGVGGPGFPLARAPRLTDLEWEKVGDDRMVSGRIARG